MGVSRGGPAAALFRLAGRTGCHHPGHNPEQVGCFTMLYSGCNAAVLARTAVMAARSIGGHPLGPWEKLGGHRGHTRSCSPPTRLAHSSRTWPMRWCATMTASIGCSTMRTTAASANDAILHAHKLHLGAHTHPHHTQVQSELLCTQAPPRSDLLQCEL